MELEVCMSMDFCLCCGWVINGNYVFCMPCERKRMKVKDECLAAGLSDRDAESRVNEVYPLRYGVPDVPMTTIDKI
jgi:hypothetical protein